jgi:eukaryotic-like serine/threonine-protein kinase
MIGKTISHYRILEKLGEGGMGVVYKVRDTHLDRLVALKMLPPEKVADPERKRRFVQEAKAASALNHPNIITIYDIDQTDGVDFIAMEYVAGKTLDLQIPRKGLRLNGALKYAVQIADALEAAHAACIIHRDLKPGNVIVSENGAVKVLDFGLAKLIDKNEIGELEETLTDSDRHTDEGTILGTVSYMSPEQAEGKKVGARSDIFSFGALLYEMVTGRRAFQGDTKLSTLTAILREDPKPPSQIVEDLPTEAERIINRCLRKDPARRWQTMADVRIALQELKEESDLGKLGKVPLPQRVRRRSLAWTAGLLALLGAVAVAVWFYRSSIKVPEAPLTVVPLTSYPGSESEPSFSPDGNQVAFSWDGEKQDNFDIYIKLIGPGKPLRLTHDPASDSNPAWSPDGRSVAFLRELPRGKAAVLMIPALGGRERKLAEVHNLQYFGSFGLTWSFGLAWSLDGRWLVISDRRSAEEPSGLFLLSSQTGEKRRLTSPPAKSVGDIGPAFSPDGRTLAFVRLVGALTSDLYLLTLSNDLKPIGEPTQITFNNWSVHNPVWTSDGREIIFPSNRGGSFSLWRTAASAAGQPQRLASVGEGADELTISRPGRLVYTRSRYDIGIWRLQVPGSHGKATPPMNFIPSTHSEYLPQFSPDGKRIAFESGRSGSEEIWVCDSDGSNPVPLTSLGSHSGTPRWSPDGTRIVFDSRPEGQPEIYVINSEGGVPQRLTNNPSDDTAASWSRDGRWIYFASNRTGAYQVWKIPASGGAGAPVTGKGGFAALESLDGNTLYYAKSREATSLWKVPVEGGEERQVLGALSYWANFALVDQGIYFIPRSEWAAGSSIQFFNFATERIRPIGAIEKPVFFGLSVSPDGRWILYSQFDQGGSDLMLVENFR